MRRYVPTLLLHQVTTQHVICEVEGHPSRGDVNRWLCVHPALEVNSVLLAVTRISV